MKLAVDALLVSKRRLTAASKAFALHAATSCLIGLPLAVLVFGVWYPYPYRALAGGTGLFVLLVGVDLVCGPLLTAVLYNPDKRRLELWRDLSMVVLIQVMALVYGVHAAWYARPLYLVLEIDRFKVIAAPDLADDAAGREFAALPGGLQPSLWSAPLVVGVRRPRDEQERQTVLLESVAGGRDYAERPAFYVPYEGSARLNALERAKPLGAFLERHPEKRVSATDLLASKGLELSCCRYLPIVGREDWVGVLGRDGQLIGFLPGDGW